MKLSDILKNGKFPTFVKVGVIGLGAAFIVGLFLLGALAFWGGSAAYRGAVQLSESSVVKNSLQTVNKKIQQVTVVNGVTCLDRAQSLLNLNSWIASPIGQNITSLKVACLGTPTEACKDAECMHRTPAIEYKEGEAR